VTTILIVEPVVMQIDEEELPYLAAVKASETDLRFATIDSGPVSIETFYDEAQAVPAVLRLLEREAAGCDAVVIDCFADPAVRPARELIDIPVVGPAEASMALALQLGHRFAVVSVFGNAAPWIELQARAMGLEKRLAAAVGVDIPVLELAEDLEATAAALFEAARDCIDRRGADVIVLGCTGMYSVAARLRTQLDVPVVEPLAAALKTAESLAVLGLAHSHGGLYCRPNKDKLVP